jgi:hypothetical protein
MTMSDSQETQKPIASHESPYPDHTPEYLKSRAEREATAAAVKAKNDTERRTQTIKEHEAQMAWDAATSEERQAMGKRPSTRNERRRQRRHIGAAAAVTVGALGLGALTGNLPATPREAGTVATDTVDTAGDIAVGLGSGTAEVFDALKERIRIAGGGEMDRGRPDESIPDGEPWSQGQNIRAEVGEPEPPQGDL